MNENGNERSWGINNVAGEKRQRDKLLMLLILLLLLQLLLLLLLLLQLLQITAVTTTGTPTAFATATVTASTTITVTATATVIFVLKVYCGSISHNMGKLCLTQTFYKCSCKKKTFHSYLKMFDLKENLF